MRVVSLVPSLTETLFALGLSEREVVGATKWCVHPEGLLSKVERIGGTKDPHVPRIVEIAPDLVVANWEENRREDVRAFESAGLRVLVTDVRNVGETPEMVRALGEAVGRATEGRALADSVSTAIRDAFEGAAKRSEIPVYCPIWRRPWMTINADTYAASMLKIAGARNVFDGAEKRYPEASPEEARERGAKAALLPSEPYPFAEKHVAEFVNAGFARERVRFLDGEALTWYGIRTIPGVASVVAEVEKLRAVV